VRLVGLEPAGLMIRGRPGLVLVVGVVVWVVLITTLHAIVNGRGHGGGRAEARTLFHRAGRFQYACSLHVTGTLTLVIDPAPAPGLARLRWRLATAAGLERRPP
jgi:hypothetical protein